MESAFAILDGQTLNFETKIEVKTPRRVMVTFLDEPQNGTAAGEPLEQKFERLFEEWYAATAPHSSGHIILGHPAFLQIVALGKPAIPLIFKKMQGKPSFISAALSRITGESPVPEAHRGRMNLIEEDWLLWGRQNHYIP